MRRALLFGMYIGAPELLETPKQEVYMGAILGIETTVSGMYSVFGYLEP